MFFKKKLRLLKPGTPAPDFEVVDHLGNTVRKADWTGKRVLLWWYPKADTPGCTLEGQGFCERAPQLPDDQIVVGASFDTPAENAAFAEKHGFGFPLLCDTTRAMGLAYGACAKADAKHPERITYVIDAQGVIESAEKVGDIQAHIHAAIARLTDA